MVFWFLGICQGIYYIDDKNYSWQTSTNSRNVPYNLNAIWPEARNYLSLPGSGPRDLPDLGQKTQAPINIPKQPINLSVHSYKNLEGKGRSGKLKTYNKN